VTRLFYFPLGRDGVPHGSALFTLSVSPRPAGGIKAAGIAAEASVFGCPESAQDFSALAFQRLRQNFTFGASFASAGASSSARRSKWNMPAMMFPGTRRIRLLYSVATSL
jgi:hypothetical protein